MKLSPKTVIRLAQLRSTIKEMQEEEKELTESLKKEMVRSHKDEYAPSESPYKIIKSEYDRSCVSWHQEWKRLATKMWGKKYAKKEEVKLQKDSEKPIVCLNVEPNERYKK